MYIVQYKNKFYDSQWRSLKQYENEEDADKCFQRCLNDISFIDGVVFRLIEVKKEVEWKRDNCKQKQ